MHRFCPSSTQMVLIGTHQVKYGVKLDVLRISSNLRSSIILSNPTSDEKQKANLCSSKFTTGKFQSFIKIAYFIMVNQEYVNVAPPQVPQYIGQHSSDFKYPDQEPTGMFQRQVCN